MKIFVNQLSQSLNLAIRGFYKLIVAPIIYGKKDDYDAQRYWSDRFSKYGNSLKGVGHEGISEQENEKAYAEAAKVFVEVCSREKIDFAKARILEIGCGTGFYTQILSDLGAKDYLGVDITDVLFPKLQEKVPEFNFLQKDITTDLIEGEFDLVVMIDVIEHIVNESKFTSAMETIKKCLSKQGLFIIAPLVEVKRRELFYVNFWSLEDLEKRFINHQFSKLTPFRNGYILSIRKNDE